MPFALASDPRRDPPSIVRACNPMALRPMANGDTWQGQIGEIETASGRFCRFESHAWGVRAGARTLKTYRDTWGLTTIHGILHRWAPGSENDTAAYIRAVCKATGYGPHEALPDEYEPVRRLVCAIIRHECGYDACSPEVIAQGLHMAGYRAPDEPLKPLTKSREIRDGGAIATAGAGGVIGTAITYQDEIRSAVTGAKGAAGQLGAVASGCSAGDWAAMWTALVVSAVALWLGLNLIRNRLNARKEGLR